MTLRYPYIMHAGMGGPHRIRITLPTDSHETPSVTLILQAVSGS